MPRPARATPVNTDTVPYNIKTLGEMYDSFVVLPFEDVLDALITSLEVTVPEHQTTTEIDLATRLNQASFGKSIHKKLRVAMELRPYINDSTFAEHVIPFARKLLSKDFDAAVALLFQFLPAHRDEVYAILPPSLLFSNIEGRCGDSLMLIAYCGCCYPRLVYNEVGKAVEYIGNEVARRRWPVVYDMYAYLISRLDRYDTSLFVAPMVSRPRIFSASMSVLFRDEELINKYIQSGVDLNSLPLNNAFLANLYRCFSDAHLPKTIRGEPIEGIHMTEEFQNGVIKFWMRFLDHNSDESFGIVQLASVIFEPLNEENFYTILRYEIDSSSAPYLVAAMASSSLSRECYTATRILSYIDSITAQNKNHWVHNEIRRIANRMKIKLTKADNSFHIHDEATLLRVHSIHITLYEFANLDKKVLQAISTIEVSHDSLTMIFKSLFARIFSETNVRRRRGRTVEIKLPDGTTADSFEYDSLLIAEYKYNKKQTEDLEFMVHQALSRFSHLYIDFSNNDEEVFPMLARSLDIPGYQRYACKVGNTIYSLYESASSLTRYSTCKLLVMVPVEPCNTFKLPKNKRFNQLVECVRRNEKLVPYFVDCFIEYSDLRFFPKIPDLLTTEAKVGCISSMYETSLEVVVNRNCLRECVYELAELLPEPRMGLYIIFEGEPAIGIGPTKEFFYLVSSEFGIWRHDNTNGIYPSPKCTREDLKVLGWVCANALLRGFNLNLPFHPAFWKKVYGEPVTAADIDSTISRAMEYPEALYDMPFTYPGEDELELCPGGADMVVTEENFAEYKRLVEEMTLCNKAIEEFKNEFARLFPFKVYNFFTWQELTKIFNNDKADFSIENLKQNIELEYDEYDYVERDDSERVVDWLYDILAGFDHEHVQHFLHFVTGSTTLPIGGLKYLNPKLCIDFRTDRESLPTASICFNQLHLPCYSSREKLETKLIQAIELAAGSPLLV